MRGARAKQVLRGNLQSLAAACGGLAETFLPSQKGITELAPNHNGTFFGYYDKTPFSFDDRLVLGMNQRSSDEDSIEIGYFDLHEGNRFHSFGTTTTWSWQLGARLQWVPGKDSETVCYNRLVDGRLGCVTQNIFTGQTEAEYTVPIFDLSPDRRYALGLNFARLHRMRKGYGYGNLPDRSDGNASPDDDGVVRLDLQTGRSELLLSLAFLSSFRPRSTMLGAEHYVNHLSFSPSGSRFLVLHLWRRDGKTYSRAVTCDIDGRSPYVIEEAVNLSHYSWQSDTNLLIHTSRHPSGVSFNLYKARCSGKRRIGEGVLRESGHPSYSPDRKKLVVDTYPNMFRRQRLILCTGEGELISEIGRFYSPPKFSGEQKCDLHPRWDRTGSRICIDSSHRGYRAMYLIKLSED